MPRPEARPAGSRSVPSFDRSTRLWTLPMNARARRCAPMWSFQRSRPEAKRPRRSRAVANTKGCAGSALRELEPLARSRPPVLLPLHRARVARKEPGLLERRPELRIHLGQRPADAVADGAGLAREPAAA